MSGVQIHPHRALPALTRKRLGDLAACPRRFWLREVARLAWPASPSSGSTEASIQLGQAFHQHMRRHFAGFPQLALGLPEVDAWWRAWQRHGLSLPPGRHLPEVTLSVPCQGGRLLAKYDLLVLPADESERIVIMDWKTERRPRTREELAADIQTDLYPYILAEGGTALVPGSDPGTLSPNRIDMVYWQANDPLNPVTFRYSIAKHASSQHVLDRRVERAKAVFAGGEPPPVDDLEVCARCRYGSYCGRAVAPIPDIEPDEEPEPLSDLEPVR